MKCYNDFPKPYFSPTPRISYTTIEPELPPLPGQKVIGYMIYEKPKGLFTEPNFNRLSSSGACCSIILLLFFWPLTCLPCCLSECQTDFQVIVYG
jgi:hypothetical protein